MHSDINPTPALLQKSKPLNVEAKLASSSPLTPGRPCPLDTVERGPGGAPCRPLTMPTDPAARKRVPLASGCFYYFPDALIAVAGVSWAGNDQHNPGLSVRWTRGKSADHLDTAMRHLLEAGRMDTDGQPHLAKAAWRVLAALQEEIEGRIRDQAAPHACAVPFMGVQQ